ncbi:MAG: hypothetical protein ACR2GO_08725 [Candidatus Limnocylindria bacterium]
MPLPALFLVLLLAAPMPNVSAGPEMPLPIAAVPDEPGVTILPDAAILQTVVADLDADGEREVVRLVRGDGDAVLAEIWGLDAGRWDLRGAPVEVVPPSRIGTRIDPVYQSTPVRLLVRTVDGADRVTVASQPHFEEIDVGPACCLVLHDLAIEDGATVRRSVSTPNDVADAVIVIDFDGDGTDELLSTQSLPPAGDISYPIEARVHRWTGDGFDEPTETQLPVGSGDSPFLLGDSDGLPGEEAGIISTIGPQGLFRIRTVDGDQLELDTAGFTVEGAVAVPLGDARGVAVVGPVIGLMVAAWPAGAPVSAPFAESSVTDGRIVGSALVDDQARLVVHQPASDAILLLGLPDLRPHGVSITRSPAAANFGNLPLASFSGPLPGGGIDGEHTIIHAGRLIPSPIDADRSGTSVVATLAGAEPVGLLGVGRELMVLHHGSVGGPAPGAGGGALVVPTLQDQGWTSIAPFELTRIPEPGDGTLDPPLRGAVRRDDRDGIAVGRGGFRAEVMAPPGSRVVVADSDPSVFRAPIVVPESGSTDVPFVPPIVGIENPRYQASLRVLTPAGHAFLARWDILVLTKPPPLELTISTSFGSVSVEVRGETASYASVRVDGLEVDVGSDGEFVANVALPPWPTNVEVEVSDAFGNIGGRTVSGIGYFDYRGLPWLPISATLVALAGVVLFFRVPRSIALPRRPDDDAALEELEPD